MVMDSEGDHINTAELPLRKLPIMGKEPPHANRSGKETVQFLRRSGERGFDERPIMKLEWAMILTRGWQTTRRCSTI